MPRFCLSFVTITKDDPKGLGRTLESMAAWRALPGVEQIVVYAGADPLGLPDGVRGVRQARGGIASAFNDGLRVARGEWLWFVNGGDAVHEDLSPEWLLRYLDRTRADLVTGGLQFDDEQVPRAQPGMRDRWPLLACWLMHPATLVRRDLLVRAGGFETKWRVAMDYDLWHRLVGPSTPVDVLSVPFARFARGGVSEKAETQELALAEDAAVIRSHAGAIWREVARLNLKWSWRWLKALLRRKGMRRDEARRSP